jgi:hypothetical protein
MTLIAARGAITVTRLRAGGLRLECAARLVSRPRPDHALRRGKRRLALWHGAELFGLQVREQRLLVGQETRASLKYPFQ